MAVNYERKEWCREHAGHKRDGANNCEYYSLYSIKTLGGNTPSALLATCNLMRL